MNVELFKNQIQEFQIIMMFAYILTIILIIKLLIHI